MRKKNLTRPFLKPVAPGAFIHQTSAWSLVAVLSVFFTAILAICHAKSTIFLRLLAHEHGVHVVATAAALYTVEAFIIFALIGYTISPSAIPLHRAFHGRLRYRRFHVFHMRRDRLRRAIAMGLQQSRSLSDLPHCSPPFVYPSPMSSCCIKNSVASHFIRPVLFGGSASTTGIVSAIPPPKVLELSDTDEDIASELFAASEWLGKGLCWNDSIPPAVRRARNLARRIPPGVKEHLIPTQSVNAATIISTFEDASRPMASQQDPSYCELPPNVLADDPLSVEFVTFLTGSCRSLLFGAITREHVAHLRKNFDNAWLAGSLSIILPVSPGHRWPLWIESLVGTLQIAVEKQRKWITSDEWLQDVEGLSSSDEQADLAEACRERLAEIPWDASITGFGDAVVLNTGHLAMFLSDEWLDDEMINASSSHILSELSETSRVRIANCFLIPSLRCAHARYRDQYIFNPNSSLDRAIRDGDVDILEVPLNPGNHWAGVKVDLRRQTFAYRDGANHSATVSNDTALLLSWYLDGTLGHASEWSIAAPVLCPHQEDSFSCGIAYLSSIAAEHVGYDQWSQDTYIIHRMEWFLRISERLLSSGSDAPSVSFSDNSASTGTVIMLDNVDAMMIDDEISSPSQVTIFSPSVPPKPVVDNSPVRHVAAPRTHRKRPASSISDSSSDSDSESGYMTGETVPPTSHRPYKRAQLSSSTGRKSKITSWQYQRALRDEARSSRSSGFQPDAQRLLAFRQKIRANDAHAEFKDSDPCAVRCSACATWVAMRVPYDTKRWKDHCESTKCQRHRSSGLVTKPLQFFFSVRSTTTPRSPTASLSSRNQSTLSRLVPCTGLTCNANPLVDKYLQRTAVDGGGAPSRHKIARELFPDYSSQRCQWSSLKEKEKKMVIRRERNLYQWINKHSLSAVFAKTCAERAFPVSGQSDYAPCDNCHQLLSLHVFQNRLNVALPKEKNEKFVPKLYRSSALGDLYLKHKGVRELIETDDGRTPWLKFAKGVIAGDFSSSEMMLAMVQAMVMKSERQHHGKSLRNMRYPEALDAYSNYLVSVSPRAYRTFQRAFVGRSLRSIQYLRAQRPRFEPDITPGNVARAVQSIRNDLGYYGPLALSWDDTDLEKALTVWEGSDKTLQILGATQGPIVVNSVKDVDAKLDSARPDEADKVRNYILSIPIPGIPPNLLATVACGSRDSADSLLALHQKLLDLLKPHGVYPVSLAADGTEIERLLQRKIVSSADSFYPYSIPNDVPHCQLNFTVPLFDGHPAVAVQDSKHGGKTARNQMMGGSRTVVCGNEPIHYKLIHNLAEHPKGPLFKRDVERVDKQDDRAAQRLLSAEALKCNLEHFPDTGKGLSVYLFIMGELYDAWQNRSISHVTRAKMVLRARFFLMAWRAHIVAHPEYRLHIHFISRESFDIFVRLCDSLIELMVVYRRFYTDYPLAPWLHSTEVCEHIFGMLRQLKPDFNYSDMLHLEPKLRSLMLGAFQGLSPEEKLTQTAAGYHHTYFHAPDLDLKALMTWPTDADFASASKHAFQEAEQLLSTVGINAREMLAVYRDPELSAKQSEAASELEDKFQLELPRRTLAELLTLYNGDSSTLTTQTEDEIEMCTMALAAEDVDKSLSIMSIPDSTADDEMLVQGLIRDYTEQVMTARMSMQSDVPSDSELSSVSFMLAIIEDSAAILDDIQMSAPILNTDVLVSVRAKHQPKSTSKAVRQVNRMKNPLDSTMSIENFGSPSEEHKQCGTSDDSESVRNMLLRRLATLAASKKLTHTRNVTAGVNRQVRHTGLYIVGNTPTSLRHQQKTTLQQVSAVNFASQRSVAFSSLQSIHEAMHNANITPLYPLHPGHFIIVLRPGLKDDTPQLFLGEVITMYTHSGARGGNHDWTLSVTSVGAPSYVSIRVFSRSHLHTFSSLSCPELGCTTILHIPRTHIIISLATASAEIKQINFTTDPHHPFRYLTLGRYSTDMLKLLEDHKVEISRSVHALVALDAQRRRVTDGAGLGVVEANASEISNMMLG